MIYLANPYTDPDPTIIQLRYDLVCEACAGLVLKGYRIYSPIMHWHPIAIKFKLPQDYNFWKSINEEMIILCKNFWILTLEGWKESKGIIKESLYAKINDITITEISLKECIT